MFKKGEHKETPREEMEEVKGKIGRMTGSRHGRGKRKGKRGSHRE